MIDHLPLAARVFIDGKNRPLHVTTPFLDIQEQVSRGDQAIDLVNLSGERITVPAARFVSVVEAKGEPVVIHGGEFWGKGITVRGLPGWNAEQERNESPFEVVRVDGDDENNYVAITGEDLAEALLLVVRPDTGRIVWQNPCEPTEAVERLVKAARLLAEVQVLSDDANRPQDVPPTTASAEQA